MNVSFEMIDMNNDKIEFTTQGYYEDETLVFADESSKGTMFYIKLDGDCLILVRDGNVNMDAYLIEGQATEGSYEGNGLKFNFKTFTKKMVASKHKIMVEYVMSIENELVGDNKITILLR